MKTNKTRAPQNRKKYNTGKQSDIRDSLDGRRNEEQLFRGDDNTHNVKYHNKSPAKHK